MITLYLLWLHLFIASSGKPDDRDDATLLANFQSSQDLQLLGVLFNRYIHIVFGICMKYLKEETAAEDATMQVFEQLIVKVPKHDIENFGGWLATLTRNHCLMHLRKQQSQRKQQDAFEKSPTADMEWDDPMHPTVEEKEKALDQMSAAMQQLKPEQRTCLELFFLEELSYQEVMDRTGWDYKAVKSHIQNGKRNLKKLMEDS